ncbi:XRE family transcriptional regulator [Pseudonocardia sp. ICBG1142]|uniref:XRE family transcriptional regulator n=1 Tax=Pseudonocardia sp. ICBG1142 TaxID=2846760 RepID=UPI001CF69240|nr:XRE family transcriptional regulator [Pseudonocardia sp. ICBG1142]
MSADEGVRPLTLAAKINQAFETVHRPGEAPYTNREVVKWLAENSQNGEPVISENYLGLLRRGDRTNPGVRTIEALARFFEVPAGYFLETGSTAAEIHEELQLVASLRDAEVRGIATRAATLDPGMRTWLLGVVETLPVGPPLSAPRSKSRQQSFEVRPDEDLDAW